METFESGDDHVFVRLDRGDLVLESLTESCAAHEIDTGVVVSGIATLSTLNVHYVNRTDLPEDQTDRNVDLELEGSWEVTNVNGIVADGEPHLHVSAFDGDRTVGGHLEAGCETNVLGEFTIRRVQGIELERRSGQRDVSQLRRR